MATVDATSAEQSNDAEQGNRKIGGMLLAVILLLVAVSIIGVLTLN